MTENAFKNVACNITAILFQLQCVDETTYLYQNSFPVFEIALGTLLDIRSTNELTFGGPTLILADQRNMSYQK